MQENIEIEMFEDILEYISKITSKKTNKYWQKKEIEGEMGILLHDLKRENLLRKFLNYINLYELEHNDFIYIYNNFFYIYLKNNINNNFIEDLKFYEKFFIRIKYIENSNEIKLFDTYKILNNFILYQIENISNKIYNDKNKLYYKIKEINTLINNYITIFEHLIFNQENEDSYDIFIKKEIYFNLKKLLELNNKIISNNKKLLEIIFNDKKNFYLLFPYYFLNNLNNLYLLKEKNITISIKLDIRIFNYLEELEKNPFLQLSQSNEKLLKIINIFTNIFIKTEIENIENLSSKEKIIFEKNIKYIIKELILLKNNFQLNNKRIKRDFKYLTIKDKNNLLLLNKIINNINNFNTEYFRKSLEEYLFIVYEDKNVELTFNFYIVFNFILSTYLLIQKDKTIINIYSLEEKILRETKNQEQYLKNLNISLISNIYDLINLYRLIKIAFDFKLFNSIIEKIIFSIKNYNIEAIKKYIKELKLYFILNDLLILHFIINDEYIITDDLIEIFNLDIFLNLIKNNKFLTLKIIDKISNLNNKKIKILIKEIMENYKSDNEIIKCLKNIGINIKTNILEEDIKIFY